MLSPDQTFFELRDVVDDFTFPERWFLGSLSNNSGESIDNRIFTYGRPIETRNSLYIGIREEGEPLDFTFADFSLPILTESLAKAISAFAPTAVDRIPVLIKGHHRHGNILNVRCCVDCLDESCVEKWWVEEDRRPDKIGKPRATKGLTIIGSKAKKYDIFRISNWIVPIIVSNKMKDIMENVGCSGIKFHQIAVK